MPRADFFRGFGMYFRRGFLSPDDCARLRREARTAAFTEAKVTLKEGERIDDTLRKTRRVNISETAREFLTLRFEEERARIAAHFSAALNGTQPPQLLTYRSGDFFTLHRDRDEVSAEGVRARVISLVLFLNDEGDEPGDDTFSGGALTFYGVVGERPYGFPLTPEEGLLVAFRSETLHEVKPVTAGERYTVVSWYC